MAILKRPIHAASLVAVAVLVLAMLPVLAALASYREQARRAEELLFDRSTDVVASQLRLLTSRQIGWFNALRMRLSNRTDAPENLLEESFARDSWVTMPENCRVLAYGALEEGRVVLRWQRVRNGATIATIGDDLLDQSGTRALLRAAMDRPGQLASEQVGAELLTAMMVAESYPRQPRGWLVGSWDLGGMCADPQLGFVTKDHALTTRPLDGTVLPGERPVEIGESDARWRAAVGKGAGFVALFPHVSERVIAFTGGGCALLLALLAGLATRSAGLRAALEAERGMVRMKDHLLHSVSHEFRTPLSVILSSTELLEAYGDRLSPERKAEALAQIGHSTARMNDMVGQVLLLSRIEARAMPVEPKPLDLAAFARDLARETETATLSRCPIQVTAPATLDATLDSRLLRAVLGNVLTNAVKFSPEGAPVEFIVESAENLRMIIRDHGPGISAEDLPRTREPFFRAASASGIPGTGLGLTIADKCAVLLGGKLVLESGPAGTIATLTL